MPGCGSGTDGLLQTNDKQEYLSQCIADLNLIRQPDLCVVDALECILENGPRGPGETIRPNRIIAATDLVAADAYAVSLLGFAQEDILTTRFVSELGLGRSDISVLSVMEL
ncbi:MAG: DUF362 domain-containing protein [Bacteroidales bacterium]|nr:DUF362 domain-containing protein [Bacteroidales bacterium]